MTAAGCGSHNGVNSGSTSLPRTDNSRASHTPPDASPGAQPSVGPPGKTSEESAHSGSEPSDDKTADLTSPARAAAAHNRAVLENDYALFQATQIARCRSVTSKASFSDASKANQELNADTLKAAARPAAWSSRRTGSGTALVSLTNGQIRNLKFLYEDGGWRSVTC